MMISCQVSARGFAVYDGGNRDIGGGNMSGRMRREAKRKNNDDTNIQTPGHEFYEFLSTSGLLKARPKFDSGTEWEIREQVNVQTPGFCWAHVT